MQNSLEPVVVTTPPYRPAAPDGSLVRRRELSAQHAQGAADADVPMVALPGDMGVE